MIKLIYRLFKRQFNKLIFEDQEKPDKFNEYKFAFVDQSGNRYFRPVELEHITLDRFGELIKYSAELDAVIDSSELKLFFHTFRELTFGMIEKGLKPDWEKVGFMLTEYEDRQGKIVPVQSVYSIIATYYVREDEDPHLVDQEIHDEKVKEFRENASVLGFFLKNEHIIELLGFKLESPSKLEALLKNSYHHQEAVKTMLKTFTSQRESSKSGKASENIS